MEPNRVEIIALGLSIEWHSRIFDIRNRISTDCRNRRTRFGAGLEFSFNDRFALRGVWDAYELDDVDVDYFGLEGEFRF